MVSKEENINYVDWKNGLGPKHWRLRAGLDVIKTFNASARKSDDGLLENEDNPDAACKVCHAAIDYIVKMCPELADVYNAMLHGSRIGCEECLDVYRFSKILDQDLESGAGGNADKRREELNKLERKYVKR